ncbi:hypothetical protein KIN20_015511 [Parelaphostrongylus tenuis]|uniref:Uncharacterized protein n=1 Tax=Parelaphostrongylus tenuis TaxID=148309 RepID=A0AAD5MF19_PARTN|nr:hypothetical protein KIN20_015511 [Parelaphostrongylus tenuis]
MMLNDSPGREGPSGLLSHAIEKNGSGAGAHSSHSTIKGTTGMELSEKILIVLRLQLYTVYLLLQLFYQKLIQLFRTWKGTEEIPSGKVRVYSILWRYKVDPEEIPKRSDFILAPGYVDEIDLLKSSHWIIYTIEKDYVLFALLPEPIYSYHISRYPFMYVPMFEKALAVAEVTHEEFLRFGQQLEEKPQPKTVLYTNTARCGSTLFGRMLNRPGISVCYGEPPSLTALSIALGENLMNETKVGNLLHACIICMRAHLPDGVLCVLKTQSFEARLVPLCKDISNLKHIFMFRKKALFSVERACRRTEFHSMLMLKLYYISPHLLHFIGALHAGEGRWLRTLQPQNIRELAAIVLASPMSYYEKNKDMYCHPIIWFHEVINDTENVLTSVFNKIDIPLSCVAEAAGCKNSDSQENSFLSQQN